ncbi:MAG: ribonuclease HII [Proteobacteria bacterium]|nr:MAG: ribonuclease HII [Pseudomonadota bacterium]
MPATKQKLDSEAKPKKPAPGKKPVRAPAKKAAAKKAGAKKKKKKKKAIPTPDISEEAQLWAQGDLLVFGVDEAGRGCLAGPVCAAVSAWAPFSRAFGFPAEVNDSKLLKEAQREAAFAPVLTGSLTCGVGFATAAEIDRWNIFRATHLAIARALESALRALSDRGLLAGFKDFAFLVDGNHRMVKLAGFFVLHADFAQEFPLARLIFRREFIEKTLVKGDSKVFSIASASVLAKVSRDRLMAKLDAEFPAYEFGLHKGYSTPRHIRNLRLHGPCFEHRKTFAPINEALSLFP